MKTNEKSYLPFWTYQRTQRNWSWLFYLWSVEPLYWAKTTLVISNLIRCIQIGQRSQLEKSILLVLSYFLAICWSASLGRSISFTQTLHRTLLLIWCGTILLFFFLFFFSFFFPSNLQVTTGALGEIVLFNFGKFIVYVGVISKFGAGSFLLVQVLLLLDATHSWNDSWVAKDEQKWYFPPPK